MGDGRHTLTNGTSCQNFIEYYCENILLVYYFYVFNNSYEAMRYIVDNLDFLINIK